MTTNITLKQYIQSESVQNKIKELLKDKAQGFVISLLSTVNSSENLKMCDPASVLTAAMTAASLDLPINQNLGYAYIIPYKGLAQFQVGWKGFVQLAQRSGQFKTINVSDVRTGEIVHHDRLTGDIDFEFATENRDALPIIGYVGYIKLVNGFEKTLYMTTSELSKHGMKYSQTMKKGYGLWKDNFEAMAHKTIIKLMLAKYAPLSVELQRATLADQAVISQDGELEYIDNKLEKAEDVAKDKELEKVLSAISNAKSQDEMDMIEEFVPDEARKAFDEKYSSLKNTT